MLREASASMFHYAERHNVAVEHSLSLFVSISAITLIIMPVYISLDCSTVT